MIITKERTRLLITEFTDVEYKKVEDLVAAMDNVFMYYDKYKKLIGLPTGMEQTFRKVFKNAKFIDKSTDYWPYARIEPVEHNAKPRNQLQIDFINFALEQSKKKQKLAGILSPGTGKGHPVSTKIPSPEDPKGYKLMGDLKAGDLVFGSNGSPITVTQIFPLGVQDIYKVTFADGRYSLCTYEHLWPVSLNYSAKYEVMMLKDIITLKLRDFKNVISIPNFQPSHDGYFLYTNDSIYEQYEKTSKYLKDYDGIDTRSCIKGPVEIISIELVGQEDARCIMVDAPDHLYLTEQYVVTHNTFMACYCAIALQQKTLIIAPTSGIKEQWADTLTGMFNVPKNRVLNVRSPKDFVQTKADFVVISQASLASLNKNYDLEAIMKDNRFGIKVIDEVQMWFKNIVQVDANCNIANNWYLTGTFGRSGYTENKLYQEMFGDLAIFREKDKKPTLLNPKPGNIYGMKPHMNVKMIWTSAELSPSQIKKVTSSMRYSEREGKWMRFGISVPAYSEAVFPSDGRMTKFLRTCLKVIKIAEREVNYGRTLVLTSTISSTFTFQKYLQEMFPNKKIGTYHSKNTKEENAKNKAECDILVSTISSAGTGFDMKDLSRLITCVMWSSWILSDQISGRLRRRPDGKETYMWDVTDSQIPQARAWARNRADVYKRKSKSFKVIDM